MIHDLCLANFKFLFFRCRNIKKGQTSLEWNYGHSESKLKQTFGIAIMKQNCAISDLSNNIINSKQLKNSEYYLFSHKN